MQNDIAADGARTPLFISHADIMNNTAPINAFPKDYRCLLNELTSFMQNVAETSALKATISNKWAGLYTWLFPRGAVEPSGLLVGTDTYTFYTSTKRDLELINRIFHDDSVDFEIRRRAALNLAAEVEHSCWPGIIGYVRLMAANLEACAGGLLGHIYAAKVNLMNQLFAVAQAEEQQRRQSPVYIDVHVSAALFNHFADRYRVAPIEESYGVPRQIQLRGIDLSALQKQLDALLTPTSILQHIARDCQGTIQRSFLDIFKQSSIDTWHPITEFAKIQPELQRISLAYGGLDQAGGGGGIPLNVLVDYNEDDRFRACRSLALLQFHITQALEQEHLLYPIRSLVDSPLDPPEPYEANIEKHGTDLWCVHPGYRALLDRAHLEEEHGGAGHAPYSLWILQSNDPEALRHVQPAELTHSHVIAHFLHIMGPQRVVAYLNQHSDALPTVFNSTRHTWLLAAWMMPTATSAERTAMTSALLDAGVSPAFRALGHRRFLPRLVIASIQLGHPEILNRIFATGSSLERMRFTRGTLPLQEAVKSRHAGMFQHILSISSPNALLAEDELGRTALWCAVHRDNTTCVTAILKQLHAHPVQARQARGMIATCLREAVLRKNRILVAMLAEQCPVSTADIAPRQRSRLLAYAPTALAPYGVGPAHRSNLGIRALRTMLTMEEFRAYVWHHRREFAKLFTPGRADNIDRRLNSMRWLNAMRDATPAENVPYWKVLRQAGASLTSLSQHEKTLMQAASASVLAAPARITQE